MVEDILDKNIIGRNWENYWSKTIDWTHLQNLIKVCDGYDLFTENLLVKLHANQWSTLIEEQQNTFAKKYVRNY